MLIKFSDDLRAAVLGKGLPKPDHPPAFVVMMTEHGLEKVPMKKKKHFPGMSPERDLSSLPKEIPEWLKEALQEGDVVSIPIEDWHSLPDAIRAEGQILKY